MKRHYELIVFDLDGTLIDSEAKILRCLAAAAADLDFAEPGAAAARNIIGLGMEEALTSLFPDITPPQREQFFARFREHYLYLDDTRLDLFPGVSHGLTELAQAGYLLAIATGRPRRGLDRVLSEAGLQQLFVATRCADEATSKPHPRMLKEILAKTDTAPRQAIMVGDTVYDLQMARGAGVDALAVSYGVHERERLLEEGPVGCVDSFGEVCTWLR